MATGTRQNILHFNGQGWAVGVGAIALLLALPILTVIQFVFHPPSETWTHLVEHVLGHYITNSILLSLGVAMGTFLIGVPAAWICATYSFPLKRLLELLLLLPLAVPAYVIAYTYTGLLDFSGPIQTGLRNAFDWRASDYWFPEVRSLPGAVMMLSLVLYPYVYLLTRAVLIDQCASLTEAARTLGANSRQRFLHVLMPLARPAIVAGVSLALMETLADFGTVEYFGVDTFTTGIFRTWFGFGEPVTAAQLASILILFVAVLLIVERRSRRRARYHNPSRGQRNSACISLQGAHSIIAIVACLLPPLFGFLIPMALLITWAIRTAADMVDPYFWQLAVNSILLATMAALTAVSVAVILGYGRRNQPSLLIRSMIGLSGLGYAIPGVVIAVGVLILLGKVDQILIQFAERLFDMDIGLLLTGTLVALVFAHLVRFLSIALQTVEANLQKVHYSMDEAVRILGGSKWQILRRVHLPLIRNGLLTATLLVFVEVMKELPATLVLRPFNFNTLAVRTYELASDERLMDASTAALAIVLCGIIPVALLNYSIRKNR